MQEYQSTFLQAITGVERILVNLLDCGRQAYAYRLVLIVCSNISQNPRLVGSHDHVRFHHEVLVVLVKRNALELQTRAEQTFADFLHRSRQVHLGKVEADTD